MNITIRNESHDDAQAIHNVTVAAFLHAAHTDHTEQFVVSALRKAGALTVSLVAEESGKILGHVAISPVVISDGSEDWYGLGPISVIPEQQKKGIGSQLMHAAISELRRLNAGGCVLLGDPGYYQRFGFKPVDGLVLADVPPEYFQALKIGDSTFPQGLVSYHQAFSATE